MNILFICGIVTLAWIHSVSSDIIGNECQCTAAGDPHYRTFDGLSYDYMGKCSYTFAESLEQGLECSFSVRTFNGGCASPVVSCVSVVEINFMDHVFEMDQGTVLRVDKNVVHSKSVSEGENVQVNFAGGWLVLNSVKCGLKVEFDGYTTVKVTLLRSQYEGKVRGLCGNCNANAGDDFTMKSGARAGSAIEFGNSFLAFSEKAQGRGDCQIERTPPVQPHPCRGEWERRARELKYCGAYLTENNGPFNQCIRAGRVNVDTLYQSCRYDVCMNKANLAEVNKIVCESLRGFSVACAEQGFEGIEWRKSCGCELKCPGNQIYLPKVDPCPASCDSKREKTKCPENQKPKEGCGCKAGFLLYGSDCIQPEKCPPKKEITLSFKRLKSKKLEQTHTIDRAWDDNSLEEGTFGDNGNPLTMKRSNTKKGHHKENKTNKEENVDLTEANVDGNGEFMGAAGDFMKGLSFAFK